MFPTTLASVARMIVMTLQQQGVDGEALMREIGMNPVLMHDPNARFPFSAMSRLWRHAVEESGDPCIGLRVARQFHPAALHGLGFAWLASDSLADAMQRMARYYRVATTASDVVLEQDDQVYRLVFRPAAATPPAAPAAIDALVTLLVLMCRLSAGEDFRPHRIDLPRPRPAAACHEALTRFLRAPLTFEAAQLVFSVDADVAEAALPTGNSELAHANEKVLIDYLAHLDRREVGARVKARLVDALPAGPVSEADMARSLNLSARSLQRRLREEQTSYKELLDRTRHELALRYLGNSRLSVNEVTYLLGFSDPSNFARAFRRWEGTSPSRYRDTRIGRQSG